MGLLYVDNDLLDIPEMIPFEISPILRPEEWQAVCLKMQQADADAVFCACCAEIWACLFGIWCIFFCHPIIVDSCRRPKRERRANEINELLFLGRPVVTAGDYGIYINPDMIGPTAGPAYAAPFRSLSLD